jgi:YqaJ-like viral recombinase domain
MKIIEVVQGTPEWFAARCGIPTASNFDKIITSDGKPSKQREKYLFQLAGEKIIGKAEETYTNAAMQRGVEMEAEARQLYELVSGNTVNQIGLCVDNGYGASPDGLIGEDGGLEIKCPILSTQVSYLLDNKLPVEYFQQVQGNLLVTGRKWWDFVSYYPGMPPLSIRVFPDMGFQATLKAQLELFCKELDEVIKKLKEGK